MGHVRPIEPVLRVVGTLYSDREVMAEALSLLSPSFGPPIWASPEWPFTFTDYYDAEMGTGLLRRFFAFERTCDPSELAADKLLANRVEEALSESGRRRVNLDPGHLSRSNMLLATTKPSPHRVFLRDGIYADLTLLRERGALRALPWTYPDYACEATRSLLDGLWERSFDSGRERK